MTTVEIGHPNKARQISRLWYVPKSAFEWQTVDLYLDLASDQWSTCKTCGQRLRLKLINYESMLIRRRRRGRVAVASWATFAILLLVTLFSRSPATRLVVADAVVGVVSLKLFFAWSTYSGIWSSGRWRGHRLRC